MVIVMDIPHTDSSNLGHHQTDTLLVRSCNSLLFYHLGCNVLILVHTLVHQVAFIMSTFVIMYCVANGRQSSYDYSSLSTVGQQII